MSIIALTNDTLAGTPGAGQIEYNGQFFGTDSNASRAQMQRITLGTAQASTSGTSIDFTGIPAWVKRITVMFNGVSTNGTSNPQIQIGSGSVDTAGYISRAVASGSSATVTATSTSGFAIVSGTAANVLYTTVTLNLLTGNTWIASIAGGLTDGTSTYLCGGGGNKALSGALDRVRITTVNGTDTFDAGSINILYEG